MAAEQYSFEQFDPKGLPSDGTVPDGRTKWIDSYRDANQLDEPRNCTVHGDHTDWQVEKRGSLRCRPCRREEERARRGTHEPKERGIPGKLCLTHGEHDQWYPHRRRLPSGKVAFEQKCKLCENERWANGTRVRTRDRVAHEARWRYRRATIKALAGVEGAEFAALYERLCREADERGDRKRVSPRMAAVKWHTDRHTLSPGRAVKLNEVGQLPLTNVGWTCTKCSLQHPDASFFDLDHVVPSAKLGIRSQDRGNLQVLCPNCHRLKSLVDNGHRDRDL